MAFLPYEVGDHIECITLNGGIVSSRPRPGG